MTKFVMVVYYIAKTVQMFCKLLKNGKCTLVDITTEEAYIQ